MALDTPYAFPVYTFLSRIETTFLEDLPIYPLQFNTGICRIVRNIRFHARPSRAAAMAVLNEKEHHT